jgi:hypothetical protein
VGAELGDTGGGEGVTMPYSPGVANYGYEEFFGGEVTCPSCHGAGRIPREHENKLVALIPMNDKRLRPRRTVLYVLIAVLMCVAIGSLLLFFLFPRSVSLQSNRPTLTPTYINVNDTERLSMIVTNVYNMSNENFLSVRVESLEVKMLLYSQRIVAMATNLTTLTVPMRSHYEHYITLNATFTDEYIVKSCRSQKGRLLIIPFQATASFYYYDKVEQSTLNTFQYIRCHPEDMHNPGTPPQISPEVPPAPPPQISPDAPQQVIVESADKVAA